MGDFPANHRQTLTLDTLVYMRILSHVGMVEIPVHHMMCCDGIDRDEWCTTNIWGIYLHLLAVKNCGK